MAQHSRYIVVLAAGKGTRMKTVRPKVLHPLAGLPVLHHVLRTARALDPAFTCVVLGHQAAEIRASVPDSPEIRFVLQEPQLGTGHALLQAETELVGRTGTLLLLSGDVPLLRPSTVQALAAHHETCGAAVTVLTTRLEDPSGYGRIIRSARGIERIVEQRDASPEEQRVTEINTGVFAFDLSTVFEHLRRVAAANQQGEYYLTDIVGICRDRGLDVETLVVDDPSEVRGINSQRELAELASLVRQRKNAALMDAGVTLVDPGTTYVDVDVDIGPDTVVHPNVQLEGRTRIGSACEIHAGSRLVDTVVEDGAVVRNHCVLQQSTVAAAAVIGPFSHLRPQSAVGRGAHVGNFVELKKTSLGPGSKANHLTYLGDATVGSGVNVGAGTITCNYDGVNKHQTVIEDGAFIGSDSQLVAPVTIGAGAYVAAGSSIVHDVPAGALAVARSRQENKLHWRRRKTAKQD
ncbi:MAG: bifunctional UDP-N-acetylglucosamine diphosphorylase/glucosamine-1-phosphate N-acetyltransferase GlmU [Vicinamibacterales bacterium]